MMGNAVTPSSLGGRIMEDDLDNMLNMIEMRLHNANCEFVV